MLVENNRENNRRIHLLQVEHLHGVYFSETCSRRSAPIFCSDGIAELKVLSVFQLTFFAITLQGSLYDFLCDEYLFRLSKRCTVVFLELFQIIKDYIFCVRSYNNLHRTIRLSPNHSFIEFLPKRCLLRN